MADKNLPIKIFEKRKEDEMLTEAGGGNEPNWIIRGEELSRKAESFGTVISGVGKEILSREKENNFIPVVLNAVINDKAIAKSHRKEVTKLFDVNNKRNTIGLADENTLLIKIDSASDVRKISTNFNQYIKNAYGISAIDELELFSAIIDLKHKKHIKIKLFDFQDYELNRITRYSFEKFCSDNKIEYRKSNYTDDLIIYRVDKPSNRNLELLSSFDGIFSIVDMPEYNISFDMLKIPDISTTFVKPDPKLNYPIVGVLDSGISRIEPLKDWLVEDSHSNYIEEDIDKSHGTFVAGVLIHGDKLEESEFTGFQGCKIFDATIAPKSEIMKYMIEDELIDNIKEVINSIDEIKIWTLSAGSEKEADLYIFSDFGVALDKLQEENNVIICKSAGNCTNFIKNAPKSRISRSADSVRSLVVGSIAHKKSPDDRAEINEPSPFTRIGYAPGGIIKPDLVHYGGNAGIKDGKVSISGVNSFSKEGNYVSNVGTSFSTPRIASIIAGLNHNLNEEFDPLLLKALVIHSAKYPFNSTLVDEDKIKQMGFGMPTKIDDIIYNDQNEITLILQDTLEKGKFIDIMDFPYPELIDDGFYYGEITITLVTSPILEHTQGAEYCQSNIDVFFGTYDEKVVREGKTIRNPIRRDTSSVNMLNRSLYSLRSIKENTEFLSERMLRNFHQKFQPVKKWSINLEEFKPSPREVYLASSKKWFLKLEGLYRAYTESINSDLSQDFCLIITIKDPKNQINVYDQVSQKLQQLNFIQKNIQLRDEIRLHL